MFFCIFSTYITGDSGGSGMPNLSAIDDAYRFYGMKNPLDPDPAGKIVYRN